jgi:hypothetical protein
MRIIVVVSLVLASPTLVCPVPLARTSTSNTSLYAQDQVKRYDQREEEEEVEEQRDGREIAHLLLGWSDDDRHG